MATTDTYLNFNGNCEEAFNFYKSVFGKEFRRISRYSEMPTSDDYKVDETDLNKIMHISLPIGTSVLMGSDVGGDWAPTFVQGNNFSVSITTQTKQEAETLFNGLSEGGKITTPLHSTFWGAYFGMFTDKFGINWMVNFLEHQ